MPIAHNNVVEATQAVLPKKRLKTERAALGAIILLSFICSWLFAFATPYGEAPDEHAHLVYVEHLVRFHTFPPIAKQYYTYEAVQPPLYYMIGAGVVSVLKVITGDDFNAPLGPPIHLDPDITPEDGSVFVHPPEQDWQPWLYLLRGVSISMGMGVIVLTYATARTLVPAPAPATVPLLAASFAALIPQANFIRGSVSNENMGALAGAFVVWLMSRRLTEPPNKRLVVWIGVALGMALLSKIITAPLLLPAVWVLWVRHGGRFGDFLSDLLRMGVAIFLVAGWYYLYRWIAYGDPLAYAASRVMLEHRSYLRLDQFFWLDDPFRGMLWKSFWGTYGWQRIYIDEWLYHLAFVVTMLAVAGGAWLLWRRALDQPQRHLCAALLMGILLVYAAVVYVSTDQIIWQGRELFPALSAICVLLGLGLGGLVIGRSATTSKPLRGWRRIASAGLVAVVTLGLLALNLYSIIWRVIPAMNID